MVASGAIKRADVRGEATDTEERELVRRAISGDAQAFAGLYDAYVTRVYRHIYYLVGNSCDAEDLTAQTFLRAWEAIARFEDRGRPIAAWFLRIGHNAALRHLRSRRSLRPSESLPEL